MPEPSVQTVDPSIEDPDLLRISDALLEEAKASAVRAVQEDHLPTNQDGFEPLMREHIRALPQEKRQMTVKNIKDIANNPTLRKQELGRFTNVDLEKSGILTDPQLDDTTIESIDRYAKVSNEDDRLPHEIIQPAWTVKPLSMKHKLEEKSTTENNGDENPPVRKVVPFHTDPVKLQQDETMEILQDAAERWRLRSSEKNDFLAPTLGKVHCIEETPGFLNTDWGSDETYLGGIAISDNVEVGKISAFHVGDFNSGDTEKYDPPKELFRFDLHEGGNEWPKYYSMHLVLIEEDLDDFPDWLEKVYKKAADKLENMAAKYAASQGGPLAGAATKFILDEFFSELLDWIKGVWGDDDIDSHTYQFKHTAPKTDDVFLSNPTTFSGSSGTYQVEIGWQTGETIYYPKFSGGENWGDPNYATSIAFGDVDGDGRDEVGVARNAGENGRYYVLNNSQNDFDLLYIGGENWGDPNYATSIAFGDVDGDGRDEVGVARNAGENGRYYVLDDAQNDFDLLYTGGENWGDPNYATSIAFGDVDGDGRDEIGVARKAGKNGRYHILDDAQNDFNLLYAGGESWGGSNYATSIAFGDVDGDGRDEVGVTRKAGKNGRYHILDDAQNDFNLLHGGGESWGESNYATSIAFGDVDGDGRDEVGVTRKAGKNGRYYILDNSQNGFDLLHGGGESWGGSNYATSIDFGDIDGDGRDEVGVSRKANEHPRFWILDDQSTKFEELDMGGQFWGNENYGTDISFGKSGTDPLLGVARKSEANARYYISEIQM